jgi:non-ribosomal peptide synthetase component F
MDTEKGVENDFTPRFNLEDLNSYPGTPVECDNKPADPAYIMFTSGSTGQPKGVVITHANVAHFVEWAIRHFSIGPEEKLSGHSPLHFDLSVFDIFGALASGAQLHLVPPDISILPHKLSDFIRSSHLT